MAESNISALLATIRTLPPLPAGISRLLSLDQSSPGYLEKVSGIIRTDPALVAQIIKIANSAVYTGQDSVDTLERALLRVGVRTAVNALVSAHLQRAFNPNQEVLAGLWLSNLWSGIVCRAIAESNADLGIVPEAAYTYGLLHDVGRLVIVALGNGEADQQPEEPTPDARMIAYEREHLDVDHSLAGRLLGNLWKFPRELTLVIATHHDQETSHQGHPEHVRRLVDLVNLADSVGVAVRGCMPELQDVEARVAERLEDPGTTKLMDALSLNRSDVLSIVAPSLELLGRHATSMGISLETSFVKVGA